jgi:hypothetical protein
MGFIREPKGVDFVIAPSQSISEHIEYINNYIREHKKDDNRKQQPVEAQ